MGLNTQNNLVIGGLLLGLAEDINVPTRLVGNIRGVVALPVLAQSADLLDLLGGEFYLLEVVTDARRRDRLRDDTVSTDLRPGETRILLAFMEWYHRGVGKILHDVGGADFLASALCNGLGNFLDFGAGDEQGNIELVVTKCLEAGSALGFSAINQKIDTYRVSSDMDSLLLAVFDQVIALKHGVALDLVGGRDDAGGFDESLDLRGY